MFNKVRGRKAFVPPKLWVAGGTPQNWSQGTPTWRPSGNVTPWIAGGWFKGFGNQGFDDTISDPINVATQPYANSAAGYGALRFRYKNLSTIPSLVFESYRAGGRSDYEFTFPHPMMDTEQWLHICVFGKTQQIHGWIVNGRYVGDSNYSSQSCYPNSDTPYGAINIFGHRYGGAPLLTTYPDMRLFSYFLCNFDDYKNSAAMQQRGVDPSDPNTYVNPFAKSIGDYTISPVTQEDDPTLMTEMAGISRGLSIFVDQNIHESAIIQANGTYSNASVDGINPSNITFEKLPVYAYDLREA